VTFGEEFLKVSCLGEEARTDGNDRLTALAYLTVKCLKQFIHRAKTSRAVGNNHRVNLIETLVAIIYGSLKMCYCSRGEHINRI
jgi:hypothetical protein